MIEYVVYLLWLRSSSSLHADESSNSQWINSEHVYFCLFRPILIIIHKASSQRNATDGFWLTFALFAKSSELSYLTAWNTLLKKQRMTMSEDKIREWNAKPFLKKTIKWCWQLMWKGERKNAWLFIERPHLQLDWLWANTAMSIQGVGWK